MSKSNGATEGQLDISRILEKFCQWEQAPSRLKGNLNIDIPFEQAVKKIARATPEIRKPNPKGGRNESHPRPRNKR